MNKKLKISDDVITYIVKDEEVTVLAISVQKGLREMRSINLIDEEIIKLRDFLNSEEIKELEE